MGKCLVVDGPAKGNVYDLPGYGQMIVQEDPPLSYAGEFALPHQVLYHARHLRIWGRTIIIMSCMPELDQADLWDTVLNGNAKECAE